MNILSSTWDEIDRTGHNPTVYLDSAEERYFESGKWREDEEKRNCKPDNGCWNCTNYDGNRCTKEWNNNDPCYYIDWRDDKEPSDICSDWDHDDIAIWEQFFEEE